MKKTSIPKNKYLTILIVLVAVSLLLCACTKGTEQDLSVNATDITEETNVNKDSQSADDQEMSEGNISDSTSETVNTGISDDIAVTDDTDISDDKTTADNSDIPDDIATTSSDTKSPAPVTTKYVAVTVDDGPDGTGCGEYLRICLEQDIRLTFFVVGQNIESNSEQLEAMINAGCEIGNHSWSHSNLTTMSEDEIRSEISDTTDGICNVLPQAKVSFVRAPFFAYSDLVCDTVEYPLIDAALAESDSEQSDKTLETLLSATDGDIILLHCWNEGSITALEKAIPEMKENGFEFVTVSELFNIKGVEPRPGSVYRHISENLTGKYTPAREIFTGGELTSGDWSNWTDAAVLDINELKAMSEGQALWVEYESVANPCLILQSWSGGEGWVQVTPSSDDGSTAIFTYEDLLSQFKADSFSRLNACMIRPLGADLTVTSVSVAESKK